MIAGLIYIVIPILGVIWFALLTKEMAGTSGSLSLILQYFLLFVSYGGLLLTLLTEIFFEWSGMASLGAAYLILVAPILMGAIVWAQSKQRDKSKYHKNLHKFSIYYFVLMPITLLIGGIIEKLRHGS